MHQPPATDLFTLADGRLCAAAGSPLATLLEWVDSYPMNSHPDLGRMGAVCPFTRLARKEDTLRVGLTLVGARDEAAARAVLAKGFRDLEGIPARPEARNLRVVVLGFPNCDSEPGIAMLLRIQRSLRFHALLRFRMMGFMHPGSEGEGLWNPAFRPLRAPMPVIAIRHLVEQDAPFIARQHLQWAPYLLRYGLRGAKRLRDVRSGRVVAG